VYAPAADAASLTVLGVNAAGAVTRLRELPAGHGVHCVAVDRGHTAYVCDPENGRVFFFEDSLPAN
jgi:hypothetical protein